MTDQTDPVPPEHSHPQDAPVLPQNDATDIDKISGIVAQTRADVGGWPVEKIAHVLEGRLNEAAVPLTPEEIRELAQQIAAQSA